MSLFDIKEIASRYIEFQNKSHSPFHVVAECSAMLKSAGFKELDINDGRWDLKVGASYYLIHTDRKSLISFRVQEDAPSCHGCAIVGSHTDSPVLRLRLNPFKSTSHGQSLLTQKHGGLIERSWFDRPLTLAGELYSIERDKNGDVVFDKGGLPLIRRKLVKSNEPIAVIPDLAIHLDREKNSKGKVNAETMLSAIFSSADSEQASSHSWRDFFDLGEESIDGFELSLSPFWPHVLLGTDQSLICGPRHDDLAMVYASTQAMIKANAEQARKMPVLALFDAEETGSTTCSGADSSFLKDTLARVEASHPNRKDNTFVETLFAKSFLISADMAHGFHSAYADKFDSHHRVLLNKGLVIKENANDRYATSGFSATIFQAICEMANIPVQKYVHRQDLGCGSTIGPMLSAQLNCPCVDVGAAMWSMHSTAETMGSKDLMYATKAFYYFYEQRSD